MSALKTTPCSRASVNLIASTKNSSSIDSIFSEEWPGLAPTLPSVAESLWDEHDVQQAPIQPLWPAHDDENELAQPSFLQTLRQTPPMNTCEKEHFVSFNMHLFACSKRQWLAAHVAIQVQSRGGTICAVEQRSVDIIIIPTTTEPLATADAARRG